MSNDVAGVEDRDEVLRAGREPTATEGTIRPDDPAPGDPHLGVGLVGLLVTTASIVGCISAVSADSWGWVGLLLAIGVPLGFVLGFMGLKNGDRPNALGDRFLGGIAAVMAVAFGLILFAIFLPRMDDWSSGPTTGRSSSPTTSHSATTLFDPFLDPSTSTSTTTTRPPPVPVTFGLVHQTARGNSVRVIALEAPAQPDAGASVPSGVDAQYAAIDVEVCAVAAQMRVYGGQFSLVVPTSITEPAIKAPSLPVPRYGFQVPAPNLAVGSCLRGWISYSLAAGTEVTTVIYQDEVEMDGYTPLTWR